MPSDDVIDRLYSEACQRDSEDRLAGQSGLFDIPCGLIYLDGNSLGPLPKGVMTRLMRVTMQEWGEDLITSWNKHGWMGLSTRAGDKIARLVGAAPGTIRVCDSTSVNVLKALSAALSLRPGKDKIVSERGNFPTDLYVTEQLIAGLDKGHSLNLIDDAETDLDVALGDDVAVVLLTQVDYRTGRKLDMASVTQKVQQSGALMIWDLAHSAGAFSVDLGGAGTDFAVGCGYKFLNGGPGAPAFIYADPAHQDRCKPILAGWLGHAAPFEFSSDYRPAAGMDRFVIGTPPVLSLSALDSALSIFEGVTSAALEEKSRSLSSLFIDALSDFGCMDYLTLASPRDDARRGAQVSLRHPEGYAIVQALIARRVIGDFRAPDILRFGMSPLTLSHRQVVEAAERLCDLLQSGAWNQPEYKIRAAVT